MVWMNIMTVLPLTVILNGSLEYCLDREAAVKYSLEY
jgi:hypothetical protein